MVRDLAVARLIFGKVGVEQNRGHAALQMAFDHVEPPPDPHLPVLDADGNLCRQWHAAPRGIPFVRVLELAPGPVDLLAKIAFAADQRDADHGDAQVGCRAQGVAREHAEAAAIGGHVGGERDLHREIGDARAVEKWRDHDSAPSGRLGYPHGARASPAALA
ncbi:hypothetical protein D3C83_03070 [compost metagenome]